MLKVVLVGLIRYSANTTNQIKVNVSYSNEAPHQEGY